MPMTPRERIEATLEYRKPDCIPMSLSCRPEVVERLQEHYGVSSQREVAEILKADMGRGVRIGYAWDAFQKKLADQPSSNIGVTGNDRVLWHDERTFESQWGVVERIGRDGKYQEWVDGPFTKTDDLDAFDWPEPDSLVVPDDLADTVHKHKQAGYWVSGAGQIHPFKRAWHMRGFENFLCDYLANPEWVEAIYARLLEFNLPICRALAKAGVDMIEFWGDVAMQNTMIVPPDQWRRLDKPIWKTIIEETRKVNPDVKFFFHSDGDVTPIIDDIIEVGFDILNPIQPECVNPAIIKQTWGDRVVLDGGGSVQRTLPRGSLDDVRKEIDFLMTTCAYNGGFMLRPSNVVPYDVPTENVVTFFEMARDYDLDSLTGPPVEIPDPPPCMHVK